MSLPSAPDWRRSRGRRRYGGQFGGAGRTVTSKLVAILAAFANGRDYTLSELAMQTNLAVSTVYRLLSDLVHASLVERPDGAT